jgi:hypothetical protein
MGAQALMASNSACGVGGLVTPLVGSLAPGTFNTCDGPVQYTTDMGPLGTWQTWEATLAFDGVLAIASLGASLLVFTKRAFP